MSTFSADQMKALFAFVQRAEAFVDTATEFLEAATELSDKTADDDVFRILLLDLRRIYENTGRPEQAKVVYEALAQLEPILSSRTVSGDSLPPADAKAAMAEIVNAVANADLTVTALSEQMPHIAESNSACRVCGERLYPDDVGFKLCNRCRTKPGTLGDLQLKSSKELSHLPTTGALPALRHLARKHFQRPSFDATTVDHIVDWLISVRGITHEAVKQMTLEHVVELLKTAQPRDLGVPSEATTVAPVVDASVTLSKRCQRNWAAYQLAAAKLGQDDPPDKEAHQFLKENDIREMDNLPPELSDYEPPKLTTFTRYITEARNKLGQLKNQPRHKREHGKSVVRADQIDQPRGED